MSDLANDAAVLSLQNGVSTDDILRSYVPPAALIGGVCYISAAIAAATVSRAVGHGERPRRL